MPSPLGSLQFHPEFNSDCRIIADETTDCSNLEQIAFCLRFFSTRRQQITEMFVGFELAPDLRGKALAAQIISFIRGLGLQLQHLVGQGYDGASAMAGEFNGVQKFVREEAPLAAYVHCSCHCLNLALAKCACVREIETVITAINEIAKFINDSPKRAAVLKRHIEAVYPTASHTRLQKYCETRWVQRHNSVAIFAELLDAVSPALEEISHWPADQNGYLARCHLKTLEDSSFYLPFVVLRKVLAITSPVAVALQDSSIDLLKCVDTVRNVIAQLEEWRLDDDVYRRWFEEAERLFGGDITMPRLCGRQRNRNNVPAETAAVYYRRAVFCTYIDAVITSLKSRFVSHEAQVLQLCAVVPKFSVTYSFEQIRGAVEFYGAFLSDVDAVEGEYLLWARKWKEAQSQGFNLPGTATAALIDIGNDPTYRNMHTLLQIFATIPVTTATGERAFSHLRLLKTYLRSTMAEERLSGLSIAHIHRSIDIPSEEVVERYARQNRRLDL